MDWLTPIDVYCERHGPHFWAEPINAWTNLAFIVAGVFLVLMRRRGQHAPGVLPALLPWLLMVVGVCSFLFHTFAVAVTGLLDVLAIAVFIIVFLVAFLRGVAKWPAWAVVAAVAAVLIGSWAVGRVPPAYTLAGTLGYAPAWLALVAVAVIARRLKSDATGSLVVAVVVFVPSAAARALDGPLCHFIPIGTHFLWHLLNAVVLGFAVLGLERHHCGLSGPDESHDTAVSGP